MKIQNTILRTGFALFSVITSFIFVYYAVGVISGGATQWLKTFAYVSGGYGLMNVYILSWAWRSQADWTVSANMVIAVCFFGAVLMNLARDGLQGGMQIVGILGLAAFLAVNWFTVRLLCRKEKP